MTTTFTQNFRFPKPDFRSPDWAPQLQAALDAIDTALKNIMTDIVLWSNATNFQIGKIAIDNSVSPSTYWICNVNHLSANAPTTFAQDRVAHPTYWAPYSFGLQPRGAWANDTNYNKNDIAYDSVRGITGIAKVAHTSNHAGTIVTDAANWDFIVNLPTVFTAVATTYSNVVSGLAATNVQDAVDQIQASVIGAYTSSNINYDHTASGMAASNVKAAIDELKAAIVVNTNSIASLTTAVNTGLIVTGFQQWRPTNETITGWVILNGTTIGDPTSGASQRADNDTFNLYSWFWNNFSNTDCPVSSGRGANPTADFAAHKTIGTLDMRGTNGGLGVDTMGGGATTRLTGVPVTTGSATTPSSILGENLHALVAAEHASHLHAVFPGVETHTHTSNANNNVNTAGSSNDGPFAVIGTGTATINAAATGQSVRDQAAGAGTANQTATQGSGTAHNTVQRSRTGYWYAKL